MNKQSLVFVLIAVSLFIVGCSSDVEKARVEERDSLRDKLCQDAGKDNFAAAYRDHFVSINGSNYIRCTSKMIVRCQGSEQDECVNNNVVSFVKITEEEYEKVKS